MSDQVMSVETVIDYIESHLEGKMDLETVAEAVHFSKYHLHHMFTATVGMTVHDYVQRRQLTEAAKLLVFSGKPIVEIAFICGYGSQQAFTTAFKSMYKLPPAEFRERREFYPLQLRFSLNRSVGGRKFVKDDVHPAQMSDIPDWMELMRLVIDGYPVMNEEDYLREITRYIEEKQALILRDDGILVGAMAFSVRYGSIEFLGVHPQYRNREIQSLFLDVLLERYLRGRAISTTTYREGDKADTGYREMLKQLGFAERELLMEFGYPTQRFVLEHRQEVDEK